MAAFLAVSTFILTIWLPRHSPLETQHRSGAVKRVEPSTFRQALSDRLVLAVTAHQGLISLSTGASFSFLGLRLEDSLHASPFAIGVAFATQDITGGCAQPLFGRLADRFSRRLLVATGLGINGALLVWVGFAPAYLVVVLLLFSMGAAQALSAVASGALQVVAGRRVGMGTVLGLGSAANGAGIVVGSVVGGVLVGYFGISAAFVLGGALMGAGVPVFLTLTRGVATREADLPGPHALKPAVEGSAAGG
jgi:MFS transporter, DHA1 family, multidrug resistance protein